ncbi:MAG: GNAT family N-acetyltransferase [Methylacidiphilales bacterium]|nr:GNAT family N-acetyltransferase [Candidatus Methylacidiphilales bacterium]
MQINYQQTLEMRNFRGAEDLQPIVDLINVCDRFDNLDDGASVTELKSELDEPSVDKNSDRIGKKVGFIEVLGTRRNYRRMGLGKAMLLAGLQRLQDKGIEFARLGVDADNPNGALQLYESVGFTKQLTKMAFFKDI